MTDLQQLLDEYLATRRALGVGLKLAGRLLQRFVAFAAQSEAAFITTELALQWATEPRGVQPAQWANRLGMVRRFARFANAVDSRHEVPPPGLLSHRYRRSQPYLYGDGEIADLLRAAQGLSGTTGLRPCTYATLLALLAVTGMRSSEPLRLDRDEVDLARGVLTVRKSKFGKSRYIPVRPGWPRRSASRLENYRVDPRTCAAARRGFVAAHPGIGRLPCVRGCLLVASHVLFPSAVDRLACGVLAARFPGNSAAYLWVDPRVTGVADVVRR